MAYNLETLIKIIQKIIHPHPHHCHLWTLDSNKKPEIESLLEKALSLQDFFRNSSQLGTSLQSRIRDAAYEAEDILESHLVDAIHSVDDGVSFTFSPPSLHKVIGELDYAEEERKKMMDDSLVPDSSSPAAAASSRTDPNPEKILVGLNQDTFQLKDRLTGQEAKLEIIPIVGMGGIGKTALARDVYDDPLIVSHFDARAWVTVSQAYDVQLILLCLLECIIGKIPEEMLEKPEELPLHLHKSLWGRRYLIVLDDMWDKEAWDEIQSFIPDNKNRSRVMVTTRESSVANYVGSNSSHHQVHLLNEDDSWNLLRAKVFVDEACPPELETIGKRIADNCRGLPIAIHVIGGVLSQARSSQEYWLQVANDVASVAANNDEQFSKILSLSYNHLPNHLKPCFLYMSAFPEDYEIRSSKLIRLWVAEGFLEPVSNISLEEAAEAYLKALVDRNLVFVRQQATNGMVKSCGMHDLLRDLCVERACQEKFLYHKNIRPRDALSLRRVSIHPPNSYLMEEVYESMRLVRSIFSSENQLYFWDFTFQLLRVLDILELSFPKFPKKLVKLVNIRYLAITCNTYLPSSISTLRNLQTIILQVQTTWIGDKGTEKLFEMPQLRHIVFLGAHPSYKPRNIVRKENLQTLSGIKVEDGFDRIIESAPNLKKLRIMLYYYNLSSNIDLTCLRKLETFKVNIDVSLNFLPFLADLIFPRSLKKVTLSGCRIPVICMDRIGSLPCLQVLRLRECYFEIRSWEPSEGQFSRLRFLLLEKLNLRGWEADETHFPRLERLVIRYCFELKEIPLGIGEIPTLEIIEVHGSNSCVVASARRIQEEQLDLGNDGLRVLITS